MYDNIGGKIKGLAKATFIVESIVAVAGGIATIATGDEFVVLGIFLIICGPLAAWASSWVMYGFGQLIDGVMDLITISSNIDENISNIEERLESIEGGVYEEIVSKQKQEMASAKKQDIAST